jgi:hypothetical protein
MYSFFVSAKIHYFLERVPCGYKNLASCILHFIFFMLSGRVEKIVVIIVIINNITNWYIITYIIYLLYISPYFSSL